VSTQPYDVVVAGGSFAGLVLATTVTGKVALIEKGEVGEGQTSACGTTLDLVEKLGLEESIEEVHEFGVFHTSRGSHRFRLPYPFCTFDYRAFCRLLLGRFDGDLVKASALGVEAGAVLTDVGSVPGRVLVDATGWRATLACSVEPEFPAHVAITYGLEKPASGFNGEGLHFWFRSDVRGDGYGWSFPAGPVARAGVLSYVAPDGVKASTEEFLAGEGMTGNHYHGGFLTAGLRPATAGDVFVVGDVVSGRAYAPLRAWLHRDGRHVYVGYLLTHPGWTLRKPFDDRQRFSRVAQARDDERRLAEVFPGAVLADRDDAGEAGTRRGEKAVA